MKVLSYCVLAVVLGIDCTLETLQAQSDATPVAVGVPEKTEQPAVLTFVQIRESIRSYYGRLTALEVDYQQRSRSIRSVEQIVPTMNYHFAMKNEKRYKAQSEGDTAARKQAAQQPLTLAYDGNVEQSFRPADKLATIVAQKQDFTDIDAYTQTLAIAATDSERASVGSSSFFMPSALDAPDCEWRVQATLERFDGADCHVLVEAKHGQRILVDAKLGCAMRFREIAQAIDGAPVSSWPLQTRYAFREYKLCADNLWMPMAIHFVAYVSTRAPENLWNRPSIQSSLVAKRIAVNDEVQDSLFTLNYPIGTQVNDQVHGRFYRIGDAYQEIDMLVEEGAREVAVGRSGGWFWLVVVNGLLIVGVLLFLVYRRVQRA